MSAHVLTLGSLVLVLLVLAVLLARTLRRQIKPTRAERRAELVRQYDKDMAQLRQQRRKIHG